MLNSLWGRLGLNMDKTQIAIAETQAETLDIITNPSYIVTYEVELPNDKMMYFYQNKKDHLEANIRGSDVVAAFTTTHARLVLLGQLNRIGANVCYYDTDSIIYYKHSTDDPEIPIGSSLGEWTNEIDKFGQGVEVD